MFRCIRVCCALSGSELHVALAKTLENQTSATKKRLVLRLKSDSMDREALDFLVCMGAVEESEESQHKLSMDAKVIHAHLIFSRMQYR